MRQLKISSERLTNRTENIARYFNDVEKRPVLSSEEEFKIGIKAQAGDEQAISKLISSNLRFVVSVAKQYSNTKISLEELICQGNIGLCDAARTFDPTRGFKFISYAVWHIRKEILAYLNSDSRTVRLPGSIITDLSRIRKINESILQEEGRLGTDEEIHERSLDGGRLLSAEKVKKALSANTYSVPIDFKDSEDSLSPIEWIESDSDTANLSNQGDLEYAVKLALSRLTDIQRDVVMCRLGIGYAEILSFSTIAEKYGKTSEWARTLYNKSLKIMKIKLNSVKGKLLDEA